MPANTLLLSEQPFTPFHGFLFVRSTYFIGELTLKEEIRVRFCRDEDNDFPHNKSIVIPIYGRLMQGMIPKTEV